MSPTSSVPIIAGPLTLGSGGEDVRLAQSLLNKATIPSPRLREDGIFGTRTDEAVRHFQERHRLTPDGIVGKRTAEALGAQFVQAQRQPSPRPNPPGNVLPASTVTPASVLVGVIAKELKQIAAGIDSSFNNGFDERPEVFTRARRALKFGLNQALSRLASASRGGLTPDLVAFEVSSALLLMASGLRLVLEVLGNGDPHSPNISAILNELAVTIPRVKDVVFRTLAGQLGGGAQAGSTLLRDLLGPLSN